MNGTAFTEAEKRGIMYAKQYKHAFYISALEQSDSTASVKLKVDGSDFSATIAKTSDDTVRIDVTGDMGRTPEGYSFHISGDGNDRGVRIMDDVVYQCHTILMMKKLAK